MAEQDRVTKVWEFAKAAAYELRPFQLPTIADLKCCSMAMRTNAQQLFAEAKRLAPEGLRLLRGLNLFTFAAVCAWLAGWALFIYLEFGETQRVRLRNASAGTSLQRHFYAGNCFVVLQFAWRRD